MTQLFCPAAASGVTVYGGAGNDSIFSNAAGNLFVYNSGEGKDTIAGFGEFDSLNINGTISRSVQSGENVVVNVGNGSITLKDVKTSDLTVKGGSIMYNSNVFSADSDDVTISDDHIEAFALAGDDTITNNGNNVFISGDAGKDQIYLESDAKGVTVAGGEGDDTIYSNGAGNLIQYSNKDGKDIIEGFGGNDTIQIVSGTISRSVQSGDNVVLTIGQGTITIKDTLLRDLLIRDGHIIANSGPFSDYDDDVTVEEDFTEAFALAGNDTITNYGNVVYISGDAGDDKIYLEGDASGVTVAGGAGNDTIYSNATGNLIQYSNGDGKDIIDGFGGSDTIQVGAGVISKITQSGANVVLTVGQGTLTIKDTEVKNLVIDTVGGTIMENPNPSPFTDKADKVTVDTNYSVASALAGNDTVTNTGEGNTIYGDAGNDVITNTGNNSYIDGGAGNDKISLQGEAAGVTVSGGAGADIIYSNNAGNLIISGEGKDVVEGFGESDTIQVDGNITKYAQSGKNVVVTVGSSSNTITLKNVNIGDIKIEDGYITWGEPNNFPVTLTAKADSESYDVEGAIVDAAAGNDTIVVSGNDSSIYGNAGNDVVSIGGDATGVTVEGGKGNDTIYTNDAGNTIIYNATDGKDVIVGFGDNDSIVYGGSVRAYAQSGNNVVVTIGSGTSNTITLKDKLSYQVIVKDGIITYDSTIILPQPPIFTAKADNVAISTSNTVADALTGNDTVTTSGNGVTLYGNAGNDILTNTGNNSYIDGGVGNDKIYIEGSTTGVTVAGGVGNDTIYSNDSGNMIVFNTGDGKDTIVGFGETDSIQVNGTISKSVQSGANVLFTVGNSSNVITIKDAKLSEISVVGGDTIVRRYGDAFPMTLTGNNDREIFTVEGASVDAGKGNDTIVVTGNNASIYGNAGNDKISIGGDATHVTVEGGAGNDTIYSNEGASNLFIYNEGDGKDVIVGFGLTDSVQVEGDIKKFAQSSANVVVTVGSASNTITLKDINIAQLDVDTESGMITVKDVPVPITLTSKGDNETYEEEGTTVDAAAGNDTIVVSGNDSSVYGNAGNDVLSVEDEATNVTLEGGKGNDTLISNGNGNIIVYKTGDGKDTIVGFGENDLIKVEGTISKSVQSGANVLVTVGNSSNVITIKDINISNLSYEDGYIKNVPVVGFTQNADNVTLTAEAFTADALEGNDTVTNFGDSSSIYGNVGADVLINSGKNVYLSGDEGNDKISLAGSDATGVTVEGGEGKDTIYSNNAGNIIIYNVGDGDDIIDGFGDQDIIQVADGEISRTVKSGSNIIFYVNSEKITVVNGANIKGLEYEGDMIFVDGEGKYYEGSTDDDDLTYTTSKATIDAFGGNDLITTFGKSNSINAGAGNDTIFSYGRSASIEGGAGVDYIISEGDNAYIEGGAGDDKITLSGSDENSNATIVGGAGNDYILSDGNGNRFQYASGDGKDTISGFGETDTIEITDGSKVTSVMSGSNIQFIINNSTKDVIIVEDGADKTWVIEGNLIHSEELPIITLTSGKDNFYNDIDHATIVALGGNDYIDNSAEQVSILGGDGVDIIVSSGDDTTINGGAGGDKITITGAENTVIEYESGDGKDIIWGFDDNDTIQLISGSVTNSVSSGNNITFQIDGSSNSITIVDGKNKEWTIEDDLIYMEGNPVIDLDDKANTYGNERSRVTINAFAGNDKITNSGDEVSILGGKGADTITSFGIEVTIDGGEGNDVITNEGSNAVVIGGAGNDKIYTTDEGNIIKYAAGDGKDSIFGFGGDDTVEVSGTIGTGKQSGSDVIFYVNNSTTNSITFKDMHVADLTIEYNDDTARYEIAFESSSADILDDDNFMSFEAQISDISEITDTNYSVTNLQQPRAGRGSG